MARYIDADKLIDKLEDLQFNAPVMTPVMKIYNVIELVEDQPTADVAEVVRCKDCVDYIPNADLDHEQLPNNLEADGYCDNWLKYTNETNFCSDGERRTDNDL